MELKFQKNGGNSGSGGSRNRIKCSEYRLSGRSGCPKRPEDVPRAAQEQPSTAEEQPKSSPRPVAAPEAQAAAPEGRYAGAGRPLRRAPPAAHALIQKIQKFWTRVRNSKTSKKQKKKNELEFEIQKFQKTLKNWINPQFKNLKNILKMN